nr:Gag-Pol polyprotein [Tanacetum cinerariifolium]
RSRVKETEGVRKLQSSRLGRQDSRTSLFQEEENDAGHVRAPSSSGLAAGSSVNILFIVSVHRLHELVSYRRSACDPLWQVSMAEELVALHQTRTWDLVPLSV